MQMINTEIPISKRQAEVYKKFVNLSVNEEILPQGDGTIRISPFDDYILFTLYDEVDNQDTPIDLSNVGNLYISFIGEDDIIKIPYYTNVQDLDLSQGQVLFRISEEDSKKILALDNKNFFISSQMVSENGDESDETTLYTGTFLSFSEDAQETMTSKFNTLLDSTSREIAGLQKQIEDLNAEVERLTQNNTNLETTVVALRESNNELSNSLAEVSAELSSSALQPAQANLEAAQANAAAAQASADAASNQPSADTVSAVQDAINQAQPTFIPPGLSQSSRTNRRRSKVASKAETLKRNFF
jgi:hypothetical protein